jgi:hypothetical protein
MIEPLFGTPAAPWTGIAAPAFGWIVPPPNRPLANGITFGVSPLGPAGVSASPGLPSRTNVPGPFAAVPPEVYGVSSFPGSFSPALGGDVAGVFSVPALLSAVAIRRGQPLGPTNDQEIEDFVYDALEMLPGTNEVEVRCEGGRITLTGSVQHKRVKRDAGEIAWGIPIVNDVQNNVTIATKRRARATQREGEPQQSTSRSKQG